MSKAVLLAAFATLLCGACGELFGAIRSAGSC